MGDSKVCDICCIEPLISQFNNKRFEYNSSILLTMFNTQFMSDAINRLVRFYFCQAQGQGQGQSQSQSQSQKSKVKTRP